MTVRTHIATLAGPLAVVAMAFCTLIANAEDTPPPTMSDGQDCALNDNSQKGEGGSDTSGAVTNDEGLSNKLSDCGGVLQPPPTGDPELVKPAPRQGDTPVIPPRSLPDKQQNSEPKAN